MLKTFYGELDVAAGDAEVLGYDMLHIKRKHIPQLRRKLGIVFQDCQLLTDRTVYDNLEFVLRATGWKNKGEIKDRINEVLQLVGMSNKGYKYPNELSGGEQQRIVIARAVLNSPEVILADEPTGNLDVETGFAITRLLHSISEAGFAGYYDYAQYAVALGISGARIPLCRSFDNGRNGAVFRCVVNRREINKII